MSDIGSSFDASDDTMTACEAAICMLYGKPQHKLVNALRCDMFALVFVGVMQFNARMQRPQQI